MEIEVHKSEDNNQINLTLMISLAKDYGEAPEYWRGLPDAVKNDLPTLAEMTKSNYFLNFKRLSHKTRQPFEI